MSNTNIPGQSPNYVQGQIITPVDMNNLFTYLANLAAYSTDGVIGVILSGAQVNKISSTTISITEGKFRFPDYTKVSPAPYNVGMPFTFAPTVSSLSIPTADGIYLAIAKLTINVSSATLTTYTAAYQIIEEANFDSSSEIALATILMDSGTINAISYSIRNLDLNRIFQPTNITGISGDFTLPDNNVNYKYILRITTDVNVTLPNLNNIPGGMFAKSTYTFINPSTHKMTLLPNSGMSGSTILGYTSYIIPPKSVTKIEYDNTTNSWYIT